jgi:hypothetical protein
MPKVVNRPSFTTGKEDALYSERVDELNKALREINENKPVIHRDTIMILFGWRNVKTAIKYLEGVKPVSNTKTYYLTLDVARKWAKDEMFGKRRAG